MNKVVAFVVLVLCTGLSGRSSAQVDHAPTLEQCTADLNLWQAQANVDEALGNAKIREKSLEEITVDQMQQRLSLLKRCSQAHPAFDHSEAETTPRVLALTLTYNLEIKRRYALFMVRHNLFEKFTAEDEAGMR